MKLRAFVVVLASLTFAEAAKAYCSKPDAPYCASSFGEFDDQYEFDRCKSEMQSYRDDVDSFLSCLKRESQDAISDYEDAVESFNRRARG